MPLSIRVEDQIVEGDRVVSRWTAEGSNRGKRIRLPGITISHIAESPRRRRRYRESLVRPAGAEIDGITAASRSAVASRLGGTPNIRRYSRLNCEGLS